MLDYLWLICEFESIPQGTCDLTSINHPPLLLVVVVEIKGMLEILARAKVALGG